MNGERDFHDKWELGSRPFGVSVGTWIVLLTILIVGGLALREIKVTAVLMAVVFGFSYVVLGDKPRGYGLRLWQWLTNTLGGTHDLLPSSRVTTDYDR